MPTIYASDFSLTSRWVVSLTQGGFSYSMTTPTLDSHTVTFYFDGIAAGTPIESAILYADFGSPLTGAALRTVDNVSFSGSRDVSITPGGSNSFTFRFRANGVANSPSGDRASTLTVSNVRVEVTLGQTGGGTNPDDPPLPPPETPDPEEPWEPPPPVSQYQSPQFVWFDDTSAATPGESRLLKWSVGSPGPGRTVRSYDVYRSTYATGGFAYLASAGSGALQVSVSSATTNGTTYHYKVLTVQDDMTYYAWSNATAALKTEWSAPVAPSALLASPAEPEPGKTFTLSFAPGAHGVNNPMIGYTIQRAPASGGPWSNISNPTSTSITTTAHGTHNSAYFYRAITRGTYSNSAVSAVLQVTSRAPSSTGKLNKTTVPMDGSSTITLTVTPANSAFTHKAVWYLGSRSVTQNLAAGVKVATLTVPAIWCDRIPNAKSGTASVRLETYSGSTEVGERVYTYTVTVPASVVPTLPTFAATLVKNNGPADVDRYIQNYSSVALAISGEAGAYGSTISAYQISGGGYTSATKTATFGKLKTAASVTFTARVTDSRGRIATKNVSITVQEYKSPTLSNVEMYRCNLDGVKNSAGTYVRLKAASVFSSIDGQNAATLQGRVYMQGGTPGAWEPMSSNVMLVAGGGNILPIKSYIAEIRISDKITSYNIQASIPTESVGLHILDGVTGAAIGKYAENTNMLQLPDDWTTNINADKLDGYHAAELRIGQNILHNWDFRNPINQRGVSGTVSASGYFVDRWYKYAVGDIVITSSGITCSSNIEQRIEGTGLAGQTATFSIMIGGVIYAKTLTFPSGTGTVASGADMPMDIIFAHDTTSMRVRLSAPPDALTYQAVKLELGTVSTLHLDPPMDHAVELPKCQRYMVKFNGTRFARMVGYSASSLLFAIYWPKMRIAPSLESGTFVIKNLTGTAETGFTFTYTADHGIIRVAASRDPRSLTDGYLDAQNAVLSADL